MYSLEYLINAVGLEVFLVVQPDIRLRGIILDRYLDAAHFLLCVLVIESQTVSLFLMILHNVIEKLILDVRVTAVRDHCVIWKFRKVWHFKDIILALKTCHSHQVFIFWAVDIVRRLKGLAMVS